MGLRIAQIAPVVESVPPRLYGGTERVVHYLTEELVRRGHEVTLFASGDSQTTADLVPVVKESLRLDPNVIEYYPYHMLELGMAFDRADEFDIIHSHIDFYTLPFTRLTRTPVVTTLHGRMDSLDLQALYDYYKEANLISISDNQRKPLPRANWVATVHNGIDVSEFPVDTRQGDYLAFLGRISPEKGVEVAIELAKKVNIPLRIAAKVDAIDKDYYEREVAPLLNHDLVEFIGEVDQIEKSHFLKRALALVFPVHWPEPFGLTMIEAMATGTPVIASRCGSIPEVIVEGTTGFMCDSVEEMALAVRRVRDLDRTACRRHVEKNFSSQIMADRYEQAYQKVLRRRARSAA